MKPKKCGRKWRIEYRHPNYKNPIHESFDTEEEANFRIAEIELQKKRGTIVPPPLHFLTATARRAFCGRQ